MRIAFLLPRWSKAPIGGYAVCYEYAGRLNALGHDITVVHVASWTPPISRSVIAETRRRLRSGGHATATVPWRSEKVKIESHFRPPWSSLRHFDAVVATSWLTAERAAIALDPKRLVYLIQSDETWSGPTDRVVATWNLPVRKVVVAHWLADLAAQRGSNQVTYIPNAVDLDRFPDSTQGPRRPPASVAMLWHAHPVKGSDIAVAVIRQARAARPDLSVTAFSIYDRPAGLPEWVDWLRRPTPPELSDLLHRSAIFLSCSRVEGWALPPAEAMASGCALVSSDIGGVADYAHDHETALLAPSENVSSLTSAVIAFVDDPALRSRIAEAGRRHVREDFSWARSTTAFEAVVTGT